jgi:hypothetical protein
LRSNATTLKIKKVPNVLVAVATGLCGQCTLASSTHPMALQPKSGLGLLYLLPPQCSIISGQLPVATSQKAGSILLHRIFHLFLGFPTDLSDAAVI